MIRTANGRRGQGKQRRR